MIPLTAPTWTQILNSMEDVLKQLQGLGELLKQTPPYKQLLAEKSQCFFLWGNMENAFMVDALGKYIANRLHNKVPVHKTEAWVLYKDLAPSSEPP